MSYKQKYEEHQLAQKRLDCELEYAIQEHNRNNKAIKELESDNEDIRRNIGACYKRKIDLSYDFDSIQAEAEIAFEKKEK